MKFHAIIVLQKFIFVLHHKRTLFCTQSVKIIHSIYIVQRFKLLIDSCKGVLFHCSRVSVYVRDAFIKKKYIPTFYMAK